MREYDNSAVRRQDRLLPEERALEILRDGEFGVLSMAAECGCGAEGATAGYGIPINYVFDGRHVWFHCAPEGEKLRHLERNPQASFCVVGRTAPQAAQFTTGYESVIVSGRAELIADDTLRMKALELLLRKYSPDHIETGMKYAEKSFGRTAVIRLTAERISGKSKNTGLD